MFQNPKHKAFFRVAPSAFQKSRSVKTVQGRQKPWFYRLPIPWRYPPTVTEAKRGLESSRIFCCVEMLLAPRLSNTKVLSRKLCCFVPQFWSLEKKLATRYLEWHSPKFKVKGRWVRRVWIGGGAARSLYNRHQKTTFWTKCLLSVLEARHGYKRICGVKSTAKFCTFWTGLNVD